MQLNILVLVLVQLASMAKAYFITVDAHAEECFFDKVKSGTKMGLMFEVAEGGFLDIDVRIVGPDGKTIHQVYRDIDSANFSLFCLGYCVVVIDMIFDQ